MHKLLSPVLGLLNLTQVSALQRKFKVKALSRDTAKAQKYFGNAEGLEVRCSKAISMT